MATVTNPGVYWTPGWIASSSQLFSALTTNTTLCMAYNGSQWCGGGSVGATPVAAAFTSSDAAAWTSTSFTGFGTTAVDGVCWDATNGLWIAVGGPGSIATSPNGTTWTNRTSGTTSSLVACASSPFIDVAVGVALVTSTNGTTWTVQTAPWVAATRGVVWDSNRNQFVAIDGSGSAWLSTDGINWTSHATGVSALTGVGASGGQYVACGSTNIVTSPDGVTWTSRTSGTTNSLNCVAYGSGTWVVGGTNLTVLTSPDGVTWTAQSIDTKWGVSTGNAVNGMASDSIGFVAGLDIYACWNSFYTYTDGANANTVVTTGWTNPTNAYGTTEDAVFATAAPGRNASIVTDWGYAASSIPNGSTLHGVWLMGSTKFSTTGVTGQALTVQGFNNGTSTLLGIAVGAPTTTTALTHAPTSAPTVTLAQLQTANNIRARVTASKGSTSTAITMSLDIVPIRVQYSPPGPFTIVTALEAVRRASVW